MTTLLRAFVFAMVMVMFGTIAGLDAINSIHHHQSAINAAIEGN